MRSQNAYCLAIFLVGLICVVPAFAQDENRHVDINDVEQGDLVEARFHQEWIPGTVTEVISNTLIRVEFDEKKRGRPGSFMFRAKDVRFREDIPTPVVPPPESEGQNANPLEQRLWKSAGGSFTVKAAFLKMDPTNVWLRRADGATIRVERNSLSEPDRTYLKNLDASNPFGNEEFNPFKVVEERPSPPEIKRKRKVNISPLERNRASHTNNLDMPLTEPTLDQVRFLSAFNSDPWKLSPLPTAEPLPSLERSFPAAPGQNTLKQIALAADANDIMIAMRAPQRNEPRFVRLGEKESLAKMIPARQSEIGDIHPSGKYVVCYSTIRDYPRIDLWRIEDSKIEHHSSWEPPITGNGGLRRIITAKFAGDYLVTLDGQRRLAIWNWKQAKLLYQTQSKFSCNALLLTPDRKRLVYCQQQRIHLLELATGKHLGSVACPIVQPSIDLSSDGKLAAQSRNRILVWGPNGDRLAEINTTNWLVTAGYAKWYDNRILLVQHAKEVHAIDTENRVTMARYKIAGDSILLDREGRVWRTQQKGQTIEFDSLDLEPMQYESALPGSGDDLLLFQPGTELEISLKLPFDDDEKREIKSALEKQLKQHGVRVIDKARLKLSMEIKNLDFGGPGYAPFGIPGFQRGEAKLRIQPKRIQIRLNDGKIKYYVVTRTVAPSPLITGRQGETNQETIDRMMKIKPSYFSKFKVPSHLTKHPLEGAYALIEIDENGNRSETFPRLEAE